MTLVLFDAENAKEQILCLKFSKNIKNDEKGLFIVMISNLRILVLIWDEIFVFYNNYSLVSIQWYLNSIYSSNNKVHEKLSKSQ